MITKDSERKNKSQQNNERLTSDDAVLEYNVDANESSDSLNMSVKETASESLDLQP